MKYLVLSVILLHTGTTIFAECPSKCMCKPSLLGLYDSVQCSNLNLTDLPSGNLDDTLGKLDLSYNKITVLKDNTFLDRDIIYLDKLMLNNNKITKIDVNAFRGLGALTYLNLRGNSITSIHPNTFHGVPGLIILKLNNNPALQLPSIGFDLPKLSVLDLADCGLHSIPKNFFVGMKILDSITLSGNQLSFLDPMVVAPLSQLEYLDLSGNRIMKLQEDLLQLPQTIDIELKGNPLLCDCELPRVYAIYQRRIHKEPLVCQNPETGEVLEPTQENLKKIQCLTKQKLNRAVSLNGSLLILSILTLQLLFTHLI